MTFMNVGFPISVAAIGTIVLSEKGEMWLAQALSYLPVAMCAGTYSNADHTKACFRCPACLSKLYLFVVCPLRRYEGLRHFTVVHMSGLESRSSSKSIEVGIHLVGISGVENRKNAFDRLVFESIIHVGSLLVSVGGTVM